jgi:hypothetical protein
MRLKGRKGNLPASISRPLNSSLFGEKAKYDLFQSGLYKTKGVRR